MFSGLTGDSRFTFFKKYIEYGKKGNEKVISIYIHPDSAGRVLYL